jgi:hypothetical protein
LLKALTLATEKRTLTGNSSWLTRNNEVSVENVVFYAVRVGRGIEARHLEVHKVRSEVE